METTIIESPAMVTASWFYHKMDGIDGNGGVGGFTPEEVEQMRGALIDLSNRIRHVAENI